MNLEQMLPFLIPIILIELVLWGIALWHILTHKTYKVGTRTLWILVTFIQILGPIAYLIWGRSDD